MSDMAGWYKRTTEEAMRGTRVWAATTLQNGMGALPRGTQLTIVGKQGGLTLRSEPCPHCGVVFRISRVLARDVRLTEVAP